MSTAEILEPEVAPLAVDEDKFYEVIDGQRVEHGPTGASESVLASRLVASIDHEARTRGLGQAGGEVLFRLKAEPKLQRRPDAAFVSSERWPRGRKIPRGHSWDVVPDLAVEIVSPTDLACELVTKIREYFQAGVRRVWVIYPEERIVYDYDSPLSIRVQGWGDPLDGGEVIPGLRIVISDLVAGDDEPQPA